MDDEYDSFMAAIGEKKDGGAPPNAGPASTPAPSNMPPGGGAKPATPHRFLRDMVLLPLGGLHRPSAAAAIRWPAASGTAPAR